MLTGKRHESKSAAADDRALTVQCVAESLGFMHSGPVRNDLGDEGVRSVVEYLKEREISVRTSVSDAAGQD